MEGVPRCHGTFNSWDPVGYPKLDVPGPGSAGIKGDRISGFVYNPPHQKNGKVQRFKLSTKRIERKKTGKRTSTWMSQEVSKRLGSGGLSPQYSPFIRIGENNPLIRSPLIR